MPEPIDPGVLVVVEEELELVLPELLVAVELEEVVAELPLDCAAKGSPDCVGSEVAGRVRRVETSSRRCWSQVTTTEMRNTRHSGAASGGFSSGVSRTREVRSQLKRPADPLSVPSTGTTSSRAF